MRSILAKAILISLFAVVLLLALTWVVLNVVRPGPEGKIVMATGDSVGTYNELATNYKRDLKRHGVELELRQSAEGFATLRALVDGKSGINAGFVKGGLVGSLQGRLARSKAKDWHEKELGKLRSVGRLFYEPIWVFTRASLPIVSLRDLEGKRVLTGTRQSGTRRIARQLLKANGIETRENPLIVEEELPDDAAPLVAGSADAAILIAAADSDKIQKLLRLSDIRLMNFAPEADAYSNRFPALTKVVLRRGAVEFDPLIPTEDVTLLATSAALAVRADLHPALVTLLTHAVINNPKSGFDKQGDPVLFFRAGEFPSPADPEFQVSEDSRMVYKTGELPFMLRVMAPMTARMQLPFSMAAFFNAHGAQTLLLLIPMLTIILPLMKFVPMLYTWSVRRRLLYWYRQLKALEKRLDNAQLGEDYTVHQTEIERIDTAVRRIHVPLHFSDQFYDLRGHVELVRQRLAPKMGIARLAAE